MFLYSTIARPLFWIMMGLIYAMTIAGIRVWVQELGISMTWWKWSGAALWYGLLSLSLAAGFTLIGEKEPRAGYRFLGFSSVLMSILGIGLWAVIF
jgi:hypothetical protein